MLISVGATQRLYNERELREMTIEDVGKKRIRL
jgi:hypothetical protein